MEARVVCEPTRVARTSSDPAPFTVPEMTGEPGALLMGSDSPVCVVWCDIAI
jgi:hypothetical protein